jgi:hypothetical protein
MPLSQPWSTILVLIPLLALTAGEEMTLSREAIIAQLAPYDGPSNAGVEVSTLTGKVVAGYQGWFAVPGDGTGRGWVHLGRGGRFAPGACAIEIWPDLAELPAEDRFPTGFRFADGSVAPMFSSYRKSTVMLHFRWMQEYGIDGALVQRFASEVRDPKALNQRNTVLRHAREAANRHGRGYALMYDLSGLRSDTFQQVIDDWKHLVDGMKLGRDPRDRAYFKHRGKPLVAVWGVGFNDNRHYTLADCERLIDLLKDDPQYGGNTVMLGVPYYFRELKGDTANDPELHRVLMKADILSPWAVGRFGVDRPVAALRDKAIAPDVAWCSERTKDYLPVVWPGFSWHNLRAGQAAFDQIPRQKGEFMWRQAVAAKQGGATMLYVAMFDEMDEATAIFKTTNTPPVGESPFIAEAGIGNDHYLWLTGEIGRMLRGQRPATIPAPVRTR